MHQVKLFLTWRGNNRNASLPEILSGLWFPKAKVAILKPGNELLCQHASGKYVKSLRSPYYTQLQSSLAETKGAKNRHTNTLVMLLDVFSQLQLCLTGAYS